MKNIIIGLIIITGFFVTACELEYIPGMPQADYDIEIGNIYDYDFEGSEEIPEFETIEEILRWFGKNSEYVYETGKNDYMQTPEETFYRRNSENKMMVDCEDKVIMIQYLIKKNLGIQSYLVTIKRPASKDYHAMLYVNNLYYEIPIKSNFIIPLEKLRNDFKIYDYIPYSEVLWMTVNYHDAVGKYR